MPRERSPNRDKAFEIYKNHKGNITLREIANILNEKEKTISNWKCRDKWDSGINCSTTKKECSTTKEKSSGPKPKKLIEEVLNDNDELTEKQRAFCMNYVRNRNATMSAIKAGYASEWAHTEGSRLLRNVKVREEIKKLKRAIAEDLLLDDYDILDRYIKIAFADMNDFVEFGTKLLKLKGKDGKSIKKEVSYLKFKNSFEVDGSLICEIKQGKDGISLKLEDRQKALDRLAEYFDLFPDKFKRKIEEEKLKMAREKLELEKNAANKDENKDNDLAKAVLQAINKRNGGSNE